MRVCLLVACLTVLPIAPAHAQRAAISPDLSPADAAAAFETAVREVCIPAVSQGRRPTTLPGYILTNTAEARRQAGAAADEQVWESIGARGVVTIAEKAGRCTVQVYGPPAAATVMALGQAVAGSGAGFERLMGAGGGISQTLMAETGDRRVQVIIRGSDPGSPGHQSRFSVTTATVFVMQ